MLVTRRRAAVNSQQMPGPFRRRLNNPSTDTHEKKTEHPMCIGSVSRHLLVSSFLRIRRNIWYSIVPEFDETADISSGIRQSWDDLMSLLLHCGLIKKNGTASNGFDIISSKWHEFRDEFPPLTKLHYGEYKKKENQNNAIYV